MASGPDRRTFVRGAAGAVGLGAVGAFSSKLQFVGASEPPGRPELVPIPVTFETIGSGPNQRTRVLVPDVVARSGDEVEWSAPGDAEIVLVAFKGRSPWKVGNKDQEVLPGDGTNTLKKTVPMGVPTKGKYSYTIVVKDSGGNTYAKDPDLDLL